MWCIGFIVATIVSQVPDVESVKIYRGSNGELVDVAMLKPASSNRALVRVRHADSPHDGLVLPCEVERNNTRTKFVTRHEGSGWTVLSLNGGYGDFEIPGRPAFSVSFDKKETATANSAALLAAHEEQKKAGTLKLFQRKSYPKMEAKYEGLAKEAVAKLRKSCGRDMTFSFDWGSFGDEVMAEVDAWKACAPIVARLESSCGLAKEAEGIVCRMGESFGLELNAGQLVFVTTPKGRDGGPGFLSSQK